MTFYEKMRIVCLAIPEGCVATYGQIAMLCGAPKNSRQVGHGLKHGLAGEDIPLSARVMAVADVFDALVSRRSYKEPFSFEKAMEIIKEGAGTQFDPEIARIFIESEEDVRKVTQAHEEMLGKELREPGSPT